MEWATINEAEMLELSKLGRFIIVDNIGNSIDEYLIAINGNGTAIHNWDLPQYDIGMKDIYD